MKNLLLCLFAATSFAGHGQKISGLYSGTLYNDTTKMVQQYELALSEYRGKITGYSYVTFVKNDTYYYGIREIKAHIDNDQLIVEDDRMLANNFPEAPAKHVHRISTIPLHGQDSIVSLNGRWTTTKTKEYFAVPGSIALGKDNDSAHSALIGHLKELGIIAEEDRHIDETVKAVPKQKVVATDFSTAERKKTKTKHAPLVSKLPEAPSIPFDQRKVRLTQSVEIPAATDSLILAFYDNGEIDGDSISVYVNGKPLLQNNRLTANANKKTIYLKGLGNEITILVVAENLGTIPPNTGLVVIHDGTQQYQVNFSADLQTNASIVLHRK
jgi:hypothetical protein